MAPAKSEYTVVARRYRPQQFHDLVGQESVAQALTNALTGDRVAHAYLFTGARGVGKTSTARILAKALNCVKGPTPTPCDECSSCQAIAAGDDIDVREIDGASNNGVEHIRGIRQDVATRPTRGRYKIYIIDEVHMLSPAAFNALLKTLEEPPPHVKFIFATTEHQRVPITILSRCQRFDFGNISAERIAGQLRSIVAAENMAADDDAIDIIARRASGSMRDAQSLLDQLLAFGGARLTTETVQHLLGVAGPERVMALADAIMARDAGRALGVLEECSQRGLPSGELLDQLIEHWRDLMLVAAVGREARNLNTPARYREALEQQAAATTLDTIMAGMEVLASAKQRQRGGHAQTLLQMALIRLCRLDDLTPLAQLAQWVSQAAPEAGSAPPAPRGARTAESGAASGQLRRSERPATLPEGKKKAAESVTEAAESAASDIFALWSEITAVQGTMLRTQLEKAGAPAISGPNSLLLRFAAEYNGAYRYCATPTNVQVIEQSLRQRTGRDWSVRMELVGGTEPSVNGMNGVRSVSEGGPRLRPMDQIVQDPILKRAVDLLDALPVFVDPEFGSAEAGRSAYSPPIDVADDEEA